VLPQDFGLLFDSKVSVLKSPQLLCDTLSAGFSLAAGPRRKSQGQEAER
jgi:hypothetical protein